MHAACHADVSDSDESVWPSGLAPYDTMLKLDWASGTMIVKRRRRRRRE